jgi:hypothetical protein
MAIFGKKEQKSCRFTSSILGGEVPLVQSIRELELIDPAALQTGSVIEGVFREITNVILRKQ